MSTDIQYAKQLLTQHEGVRNKVYTCPAGKLTIGVGRNLEDTGLRADEIELMLTNDVLDAKADLRLIFAFYDTWTTARKAALIDMRVQLGYYRFRQFKLMMAAIKRLDWEGAAEEAHDSKWARQVPTRAFAICDLLRGTRTHRRQASD